MKPTDTTVFGTRPSPGSDSLAVLPSANADDRLTSLWYEHGHPFSDKSVVPPDVRQHTQLIYRQICQPSTDQPTSIAELQRENQAG